MPAQAPHSPEPELTDDERAQLRQQAVQAREAGNTELADTLEELAADGLPALEDCQPWPDVRERMWARLNPHHNEGRVA